MLLINEFFSVNVHDSSFEKKLFAVLKKIINYNSAYIFFITPEQIRLEYSDNSQLTQKEYNISNEISMKLYNGEFANCINISEPYLAAPLSLYNNIYGYIVITLKTYNDDVKQIFETCSSIISNIIKDCEISKIMSLQVKALQEGITDIHSQNVKILEADKIKNSFLANISHELRTPLNSIIGFSEMLSNELVGSLNNKQKDYIKDIQISGLHLLGMINEILDISKLEANAAKLNKTEFKIEQAITEVCNILKPLALKKNIDLLIVAQDISVNADYQKIQQILFNIINNAIKFTFENGEVKIQTFKENNKLVIKVHDNGIGIDKKYHKKIFEKFGQVKQNLIQNESSTGLGLAITKELVKMHKGEIRVESESGQGSTFSVYLPVK